MHIMPPTSRFMIKHIIIICIIYNGGRRHYIRCKKQRTKSTLLLDDVGMSVLLIDKVRKNNTKGRED